MTETTEMPTPSKWDEPKRLAIKYWPPVAMILVTTLAFLMYGGDSAPVNQPTVEAPAVETVVVETPAAPAVDTVEAPAAPAVETVVVETPDAPAIDVDVNPEGFFAFVGEGNFWLAMTIILALILIANLLSHLKKPVAAGAAAGTLPAPYFRSSIVWFIAGVLMVLVGLWGIYPAFFGENNRVSEIFGDLGLFGIIAVGVIAITLVVGTVKYMGIAGNASAYFFMVVWVILLFFGIIYLLGGWLAPDATTAIIEAVKNDAQSAAAGIVETTNGTRSIKWEKFVGIDWETVGGIAFAGLLFVFFIHQYVSKNKIVVTTAAIVASIGFLLLSYHFATKWEVTNNIIQGAVELNPALGENRFVNLTTTPDHRLVVANIGPYDTVRVYIPPKFCTVDWAPTSFWLQEYGTASWYDPSGYYLYKTAGGTGLNRTYEFTEAFKQGLKAADATITLEFWANCQQP